MKKIILLCFLVSLKTFSQNINFDSTVISGIKQIYSIDFSAAKQTFESLGKHYPSHPASDFFLAMIDWWEIMLNPEDESGDDHFINLLDKVVDICDERLDENQDDFDAKFFKGGALGFKGRLYAFRESWLKAAGEGKKAMPLLYEAAKLNPNNIDLKFGFGIYNYFAVVIPEKYPFIKPIMLFLPSGDKEKGLKQLKYVSDQGKFTKYESRYFLMTIYYSEENNPFEAEKFADLLLQDFPDNPVFERWKGRIEVKLGNNKFATEIFKRILLKAGKNYYGYNLPSVYREAFYYVGKDYELNNQLDSAQTYFLKSLELSYKIDKEKDTGFRSNTLLYLGMINDLLGNRKKAVNYYNEVLALKNYAQSHELAEKYLKAPYKK